MNQFFSSNAYTMMLIGYGKSQAERKCKRMTNFSPKNPKQ
jgi:hypothetical protein